MPLLLLLLLLLSGCVAPGVSPLPSQVLSGPPLALVGQYGDLALEGALDRSCMVGFGTLDLYSPSGEFACTAALDAPPNEKGRVHGL
ncbi:MAG: hypothetical protein LBP61_09835, partial [Desulfovibrio sp.]|nr:hypothetical protein [Desulfovibrio sp.]